MRSVVVYAISERQELEDALNRIGEYQPSITSWTVGTPRPYLWLCVDNTAEIDMSDADITAVRSALGVVPEWSVGIDVSGKILGFDEVVAVTCELLSQFLSVAQDDHSSRAWTRDEIIADSGDNRVFFLGPCESPTNSARLTSLSDETI